MRHLYLPFLIVSLLLFASFSSLAQQSTVGKEFWVGFMENNRVFATGPNNQGAPDFAVLVITATENTTGAIEYLGNQQAFTLSAGQQFTLRVPSEDLDLLHRSSGNIENKGIYISSSGKIAVHAFNERFRSADGTVVLPVGTLGKDYYITSHFEILTASVNFNGNINNESTLLVVATEDNTSIEISTSVETINGNQARTPFSIKLNRGQSYQIKARGDLTGSRVRVIGDNADDCKKIAVFGGNKWTGVGNCGQANDHLFQQAYPVNTWGTSFVHVALEGRSSGELVKVVAAENGTVVRVNGTSVGTLNQGEWLPIEFNEDESAKIETSKPSSVTVFSKSMDCNRLNSPEARNGDPFMITYSPVEQSLKDITFNAMALPSITNHYINIVVQSGTENQTFLDGQNVGARFSPLPGDNQFSIARIEIFQGAHKISNKDGFTAYVYGFGEIESYGYAAGAALDNLNFKTDTKYDFEVEGERVACLNVEGLWDILPENPDFTYFLWDFGDGSAVKEGKEVLHEFKSPGIFEVTVTAALSPNSCDEQEEVVFEIQVLETKAEIVGEQSVCPDIEEIVYYLKGKENFSKGVFEIEGGEIIQDYGDSVLVKWGGANDNAKLRILPFSPNGCPGEPIELPVVINQRITVTEAEGPIDVCFDPAASIIYSAPNPLSGRGYEWTVTGGQIISGQGSPDLEVVWDQPGIEGKVEYLAYSLDDNQCEGKAPAISVKVSPEFTAKTSNVTSILCFGQSTGSISLDVQGGVPPYSFKWSHNSSLVSPIAQNLPVGQYSVEIKDQLGCVRILENIEITQPELLEVVKSEPQGTSCYGKPDGEIRLEIKGGVQPYVLDFDGSSFSGSLLVNDLPQGKYSWKVTDGNGCIVPLEFEITSPSPLEVDVRLEKPACPGGSNGELLALPKGSFGPYFYQWKEVSSSSAYVTELAKGIYELEVTDSKGCVSIGKGEVKEAAPIIRMPTGFDPRKDNGIFKGVSNCETSFDLWVFNRWGQLIYFGKEGWDGTVSGKDAPSGTYSFSVSYYFELDGSQQISNIKGYFTLVR
ncbi:gliding motility-associated-like protein [Algoriphagus boseongensis]|uniref:Gliding motility-associated-like protein n=1 Tax=Algoriphagus boseongensis TaxID=1442587 RepID=A0A4R6TCK3_9BACT|nr:PKD domain-containing protein [Algoriphagus boseongensis]TDQ19184.1 gliding motility-associated-like protein [Algoriphagus boseongensis]